MFSKLLLIIITFYRKWISPVIPARCRYYPTCSEYGLTAIKWHGARRGGLLTLKRLSRCHPLGGHGIDFVPLPLYQYRYTYLADSDLSNKNNQNNVTSRFELVRDRGVYKDRNSYVSYLNRYITTSI